MSTTFGASFRVNEQEKAIMDAEAARDFGGVLANYLRAIWESRENMVIELAPDVERLKATYQEKITFLEGQIDKLQDRLSKAERSGGLAGLENKNHNVAAQIEKALTEYKDKTERENLQKAYDTLVKAHDELTTEYKQLESANQEWAEKDKTEQKIAGYMEMGSKALGALVESSPTIRARYEQGGLAGLAGLGGMGGPIAIGAASLTEEQQKALNLGGSIYNEFEGELLQRVIHAILYMRQNPAVLVSVTSTPQFKQFILARQQQKAAAAATA